MTEEQLIREMIDYYAGDIKRINHFLKVYGFAKTIGEGEGLDERTRYILECAAIVHDIGIKASEEKYGSSDGKYQELEGPGAARPMLEKLGADAELADRVCWLIAHHHTYKDITGADHRILVEADFLVNLFEEHESAEAVRRARDRIFRTKTGKHILDAMYFAEV